MINAGIAYFDSLLFREPAVPVKVQDSKGAIQHNPVVPASISDLVTLPSTLMHLAAQHQNDQSGHTRATCQFNQLSAKDQWFRSHSVPHVNCSHNNQQ